MTGQGSKDFESIRKSKHIKKAFDVRLNYKTVNGCAVRGLRITSTNKVRIGGKLLIVAYPTVTIIGQMLINHEWTIGEWTPTGANINPEYSLVEFNEQISQQTGMF